MQPTACLRHFFRTALLNLLRHPGISEIKMATCLDAILGLCLISWYVMTTTKAVQILLADILRHQLSFNRESFLVRVLI